MMNTHSLTRRQMICSGSLASLGVVTAAMSAPSAAEPVHANLAGPHLDVGTPHGALLAQARICGNTAASQKRFDWFDGQVMAISPTGNVTVFLGIRGFIETVLRDTGHGWSRHRRLVGTYYDCVSGLRMDELHNPFTGTSVQVVHIGEAVFEDRLVTKPAAHWRECGANFDFQEAAQVDFRSERAAVCLSGLSITSHTAAMADLQDAAVTMVKDTGTWTVIGDWPPWLNMDDAPGHCVFQCRRGGVAHLSDLPAAVIADNGPAIFDNS